MVRLAKVLVDLNALAPARGLIAQVIAAQPDAETLTALSERFGTATFVKWKLTPQLNPEATQLSDAVLAAARQAASDPVRIAALVEQLGDPDPDQRRAAVVLLRTARADAVIALLSALADPRRADLHESVKAALAGQGQEAVGPLLAALSAPDAVFRAQVADVLGRLGDRTVSDYLLAPALAPDEPAAVRTAAQAALRSLLGHVPRPQVAAARLYRHALNLLNRDQRSAGVADDASAIPDGQAVAEIWTWDVANNQPVAKAATPAETAIHGVVRLVSDARRLAPENPPIRRLHLASLLQSNMDAAAETVAAEGVHVVDDLLVYSTANGDTTAAVAAAQILGRLGDEQLLHQSGVQPSPLAEAMRHDDRRVRFAAVEAVMAINPQQAYPGSSYLPKALEFFLTSAGRPRALVAGIRPQEVQRQAGMLIEVGYDVTSVYTTADVQRAAAASSDYELLLIDYHTAFPASGDLIQRLRRDGRTANTPIAIVAGVDSKRDADRLALRFDDVTAIIRPPNPEALQFQIGPALARSGGERVSADERLQQAAQALAWTQALIDPPADGRQRGFYDLSRLERPLLDALWAPSLSAAAAEALARLGKPAGQRALVDMASRPSQPLAARQAAAEAFGHSVRQHGILLTSVEMLRQYDRYNQSETLDNETQAVLGSILDALEQR